MGENDGKRGEPRRTTRRHGHCCPLDEREGQSSDQDATGQAGGTGMEGNDDQRAGQTFPHHIFKLRLIPTQGSSFLFWTPLPRSVSKSTRGSAAASFCLPVYLSLVYCSSLHKTWPVCLKSTPIDPLSIANTTGRFFFFAGRRQISCNVFCSVPLPSSHRGISPVL